MEKKLQQELLDCYKNKSTSSTETHDTCVHIHGIQFVVLFMNMLLTN